METEKTPENNSVMQRNIIDVAKNVAYVVCNEVIGVPYATPEDDKPHTVQSVISQERWELPA